MRTVACCVAVTLLLAAVALANEGSAPGALRRSTISKVLERFHSRLDVRAKRAAWRNTTDAQILEAVTFLLTFAPESDLRNLTIDFFVDNVRDAFEARALFPWGASMPWHIWLNDVLPYAVIQETRDPWRPLMLEHFRKYAALTSNTSWGILDAVQFMNNVSWQIVDPPIVYKPAPGDTVNPYSVFAVMKDHYASCTGLSVFYTAACRSVGIPTRLAGTPHWNRGPKVCPNGDANDACGNHNWAEIWAEGGWSFVGLNGGYGAVYPQLNSSWWFPLPAKDQVPSTLNHSINAASWAPSAYLVSMYGQADDPLALVRDWCPLVFAWNDHSVNAFDVTRRVLQIPNTTASSVMRGV